MDKARTLPPLVRGKVTGVLDFFIDEIRLFRNILMLDNFDLVLQIQWWGEVLPAYISPKKLQVEDEKRESIHSLESYYHSAKYEIKTTLELFKLYLKTCEVVELSILKAVENYVVGSAFLRDLVSLLNKNNELIKLPIFDCLGEQIGEVIIHVNFLEVLETGSKKIDSKMTQVIKNSSVGKKSNKDVIIPSVVQSNFLREKTIFYDGHSKKASEGQQPVEELGLPSDSYSFKSKKKGTVHSSQLFNQTDSLVKKEEYNVKNNLRDDVEAPCKCFPEVKTISDSSKILYFGSNLQLSKVKENIKNPSVKLANKFNSNSIKYKSKSESSVKLGNISEKNSYNRKSMKRSESSKTVTKKSFITDKEFASTKSQPYTAQQMLDKQYRSSSTTSETPSSRQMDLGNMPPRESSHVLDYLLGSDMSKDDEKIALNDFKQLSPSHNLVNSISQLCLVSDRELPESENRYDLSFASPVKQNHLNFDFENPIERSYYEKFFMKSNSPADFEIAEFLNQPENRFMLGAGKGDTEHKNGSENSSFKNINKYSPTERGDEGYLANNLSSFEKKKNCARCKYYKKLDELDTIIESLKHFEKKMISDEKHIQSSLKDKSDVVTKKSLRINS